MKAKYPERIYLCGFMASGKSTLGKKLAKKIGYDFLDTDQMLIEKLDLSIRDMIHKNGMVFFRKEEQKVMKETAICSKVVIATGGGMPVHKRNYLWLKKNGLVIFLDVPENELFKRIIKDGRRPIFKGYKIKEIPGLIKKLVAERRRKYEKADIVISSPDITTEVLLRVLKNQEVK